MKALKVVIDRDCVEQLPAGFLLVDVVVTAHQAFIIRRWEAAALRKIKDKSKVESEMTGLRRSQS